MPASQLKQLKASLREQGIVGPQKSKKQKQRAGKTNATREKRIARNEALDNIREKFNPFEAKAQSRGSKFKFANAQNGATPVARPGVTKGLGEEARRKTLLVEMQKRQKVGGITDRRFGEDDPTMTPEERALERFVKEKQRGGKKSAMFDLEDDDDEDMGELSHLGKSLGMSKDEIRDDYQESASEETDIDLEGAKRGKKRRRLSDASDNSSDKLIAKEIKPDQAKTKQEVMKEVIAKSKLHKYERQKAQEDDDDLRAELDEGLGDLYALLRGHKSVEQPKMQFEATMNPDRAALLSGKAREEADKEYDERLRQMAFEKRSQPSARTKTEEEKAEEEARKLQELEEQRLRRMQGEESASEDGQNGDGDDDFFDEETSMIDNARVQPERQELGVEDEDEFILDDIIASGSDLEPAESEEATSEQSDDTDDRDEKESVDDTLPAVNNRTSPGLLNGTFPTGNTGTTDLAYTFSCPQSLEEFIQTTKGVSYDELPTVIQRIRALHHPKLSSGNKDKLSTFSRVLVSFIPYLIEQDPRPSFSIIEQLIRHTHSLAKNFPEEVSEAFREQLRCIHKERPTKLSAGDLIMLLAISTIFPTSDHWHQVVTPAMLTMARYLEEAIPKSVADLAKGTYVCTLCLQYQRIAKRYVPELVNYALNAIHMLSPTPPEKPFGLYPDHGSPESLRIGSSGKQSGTERVSSFWDISIDKDSEQIEDVKMSLLKTNISLVSTMAEMWLDKSSYHEVMKPFSIGLAHLMSKSCSTKLTASIQDAIAILQQDLDTKLAHALRARRPLALHNHRPLAIKTSIPKFEENYHPDKHYDPDRDRTELRKLQAEHKRERKGAMRELRKDASFIAREKLREKKEKDEAYEKKFRRLVAEIQGEEGREGKAYEREKRARKRGGR